MTLHRWRNAGHLVVTEAGLIDMEASDRNLSAAGLGKFRAKPPPAAGDLAEQLRRREIALARLRRQEWERRSAEWVTKSQANAAWSELASFIRRGVADTVPILTARIAACRSMAATAVAVREVVYEALRTLSEADVVSTLPELASDPMAEVTDSASKIEAETVKVGALALLRQLDVDIANGVVVSVAAFAQAFGQACARVRQRMLALEANLPPRLWGASSVDREEVIQVAIDEIVDEMPIHSMTPGEAYLAGDAKLARMEEAHDVGTAR